ncbi:protein SAWADEE HOMEODOMAIN HOMOLOG 1-like isoform X2 [Camellia sinensis]|uniref:protein SAWADEE HOMEODOMAIN HOMOLOG 1-like isoform X2 n=1 Tax=Camellia sinensis TaxID=4442 RepID=UPI00103612DE|nr:protein SAWADEE HOMEODOMAIN HOMOLOG 1-like isoform X2 [Camellia sinensis]
MDTFEYTEMDDDLPEFTLAEIMEMEGKFKEVGEKSLSQDFCQELVASFNCSKHRTGKSAIGWEQVQSWFLDKQREVEAKVTTSPFAPKEFNSPLTPESPQKPKAERIAGLSELVFEAKSAKDWAWYDVASFLNYRIVSSGELEVRVRFAGFRYEEDEWVNVKRGIRERSIPLEPSECHQVKVGDLVLCFRENEDLAIYCDAYIVQIQRRVHDATGCKCIFVVRYDYDDAEAKVPLTRLCCRPK